MVAQRRREAEIESSRQDMLKLVIRAINPQFYDAAFGERQEADVDGSVTYGPDDLGGLEEMLKRLDGKKTRSMSDPRYTEWQ